MSRCILPRLLLVNGLILCVLFLVAVCIQLLPLDRISPPLFLNRSNSLPPGFYRVTKVSDIKRGDILRTCLPDTLSQIAIERGYLHPGSCPGGSTRIGKPIIALQGDTVIVSDEQTWVNGHESFDAPVYAHDRRGRHLSNAMGFHVLQSGECFLLSTYSLLSYDSRYYGPVPCGTSPYYTLTGYGPGTP